jgi:hypothetical protein
LNSFQIFKIKIEKSKTYSGLCPFQGLSNGATLMQIQSGRTVPLIDPTNGVLTYFLPGLMTEKWLTEIYRGERVNNKVSATVTIYGVRYQTNDAH